MNCKNCGTYFIRTGRNHKWCKTCSDNKKKQAINAWQWKQGILNGLGSGGKLEQENQNYKHGLSVFRRWAKEKLKQLQYCCERCGKEIDARTRGTWAGHHKDHNRQNNTRDNLEILCKQCHQVEHECWRAFQGVTTIPQGSTHENVEAHSPSNG